MDPPKPLRPPDESPIKPRFPAPEPPAAAPAQPKRTLPREQEQSIKERKQLLYEMEEEELAKLPPKPVIVRKPFQIHLRETPAAPLATTTKVMLWSAGAVVLLVLAAALWKGTAQPRRVEPPPKSAPRAKKKAPRVKQAEARPEIPRFRERLVDG